MNIIKPSASLVKGLSPYELIERVGRVCYKSEDKIEEGSAEKFITGIIQRKHFAMLEHSNIIINMRGSLYDIIMKHKDGTGNYAFDLTYINCSCVREEGVYVMSGSFRAWRDLFLNAHKDISYMACILYYAYPLISKDVAQDILLGCDLSNKKSFREDVKETIGKILEEKKAEVKVEEPKPFFKKNA